MDYINIMDYCNCRSLCMEIAPIIRIVSFIIIGTICLLLLIFIIKLIKYLKVVNSDILNIIEIEKKKFTIATEKITTLFIVVTLFFIGFLWRAKSYECEDCLIHPFSCKYKFDMNDM